MQPAPPSPRPPHDPIAPLGASGRGNRGCGRMSNAPMKRRTAQCAFVFEYLYGQMTRCDGGRWMGQCETTITYDDGEAFVDAFQKAFPGRTASDRNASIRLSRLCSQLVADGWLDRGRLGNHDQYFPGQEPNWQYVYWVPHEYAERIHKGRWNAEYMARRYCGDGDPHEALMRRAAA